MKNKVKQILQFLVIFGLLFAGGVIAVTKGLAKVYLILGIVAVIAIVGWLILYIIVWLLDNYLEQHPDKLENFKKDYKKRKN